MAEEEAHPVMRGLNVVLVKTSVGSETLIHYPRGQEHSYSGDLELLANAAVTTIIAADKASRIKDYEAMQYFMDMVHDGFVDASYKTEYTKK